MPEPSETGDAFAISIRSLLRPFLFKAFTLLSIDGSSLPVFSSGIGAGGAGGGGGGAAGGALGEDIHINLFSENGFGLGLEISSK